MRRLALLAAILVASPASASASAADHCRPRSGEQMLAQSAEAVVLQKIVKQAQHFPRQTITGCSRYSGKRRTLDTLQRRSSNDPTTLIGVKLAGTRVAYAMVRRIGGAHLGLIADDAIHGGRRQIIDPDGWPFGSIALSMGVPDVAWAVDAQGDVGWITTGHPNVPGSLAPRALGVWRPGLGRRLVDSHAMLGGIALRDGVLSWQRNGKPRRVDLASVPASRCAGPKSTAGTLDIDMQAEPSFGTFTACARATGKTASSFFEVAGVADANGPYLLLSWMHAEIYATTVFDLVNGTTEEILHTRGMVVDEHGSLAWRSSDGLWVRDAAGTRKVADAVADPVANANLLLRDGSTVTWPGVGAAVTLNP